LSSKQRGRSGEDVNELVELILREQRHWRLPMKRKSEVGVIVRRSRGGHAGKMRECCPESQRVWVVVACAGEGIQLVVPQETLRVGASNDQEAEDTDLKSLNDLLFLFELNTILLEGMAQRL
jgi:hypothetical protein